MSWNKIKQQWSAGWRNLWDTAQEKLAHTVGRDPEHYRERAGETVLALQKTRDLLEGIVTMVERLQGTADGEVALVNLRKLKGAYETLAAGIYAESKQVEVGALPVVLVVAGVALSVPATAWAVASNKRAKNLLQQTEIVDKELDARVWAMANRATLPPSTLDLPNLPGTRHEEPAEDTGPGVPWLPVLGVAALGVGGYFVINRLSS